MLSANGIRSVAALTIVAFALASLPFPRAALALSYRDRSKELPGMQLSPAVIIGIAGLTLVAVAVLASRSRESSREEKSAKADSSHALWLPSAPAAGASARPDARGAGEHPRRGRSNTPTPIHRAGSKDLPVDLRLDPDAKQVLVGVSARF